MTKRYLKIEKKKISFMRFIFEAYDGIAVVTTLSPQKGLILLRIAPGCEDEADRILADIKQQIFIQEQNQMNSI